jgi:integrase
MVFLPKHAKTWKLRVVAPGGRSATLSTKCKTEDDAKAIEAAYERWRGNKGEKFKRDALLIALVEKRVELHAAYEAEIDGSLHLLLADAPVAPPPAPRALVSMVQEWHDWKAAQKRGAKSAPDYLRQLKTLYPEITKHTFNVAHFSRVVLAKRLDDLAVDAPTKNRYKLAASGFAKFLVRRGVLETNFVRDIEGFGENDPRMVYYERAEAQRLIAGLAQPFAGAAAFACGFCAEWGAIHNALVRDLDLTKNNERAYVRGTKTKNRLRTVLLVEENRWVLPYIVAAIADKSPNAKVFPGLTKWTLLREQRKAAASLKVEAVGSAKHGTHTVHDWRHTHTVQLLRDGYDEAVAAAHLGHGDTNLVRTDYGVFIVTPADYRRKRVSTDSVTTSPITPLKAVK